MDTAKISDSLARIYHTEGHRIVFWYDPGSEFAEEIPSLALDGVTVIQLQQESALALKVRLETEDLIGKYLLYTPSPEPEPEADWLLDIRLYSRTFHADRASIVMNELGLTKQTMRQHVALRSKFFNNQDRISRLKKLIDPNDQEKDLDLKMLSVISRADQPSVFDILMKLFAGMCAESEAEYQPVPTAWEEIEKYDLAPFFWGTMGLTFGYTASNPTLLDLLIRLLVSDFANTLKAEPPTSLEHFLLPNKSVATNASVFVSQWRSHMGHYRQYGQLSGIIAAQLGLDKLLSATNSFTLTRSMTFEVVERQIIRSLRDMIVSEGAGNAEELKSLILKRKDGHWANIKLPGFEENVYAIAYLAIEAALDLLALRTKYDEGLSYPSIQRLHRAYTTELFRFDQLYRQFHEFADKVELAGWDVLKEIQGVVESCYSGWYLARLAMCWDSFMPGADGLLANWAVDEVSKQQHFHSNFVKPILRTHPKSRVFVIISDALRYEVAEELTRSINATTRFKAKLDSQLGVLPSYTALGMAALLPHDHYGYKDGSDQLVVDGMPCESFGQRNAVLAKHEGMALRAGEIMAMSKDQGREAIRQSRLVYIYHDQIDSCGDHASSEGKTFHAARTAIEELTALVKFIVNSLNGSHIFVTADHGFLYQDQPPTVLEKSELEVKPKGALKSKKRYIVGQDMGHTDKAWVGTTANTAETNPALEFWIPKGINRFHFSGGARFVHGGAMPQEVIVPVVQVRELEGKAAIKEAVKRVDVSILGSNRKIVNTLQKFEFIQVEKVTERALPRVLVFSLRDGDMLISNEVLVTFDSTSDSMEERKRPVKIMVKKGAYDKAREYALVLRDPETQIEYDRIPVTIDLAFINDF